MKKSKKSAPKPKATEPKPWRLDHETREAVAAAGGYASAADRAFDLVCMGLSKPENLRVALESLEHAERHVRFAIGELRRASL